MEVDKGSRTLWRGHWQRFRNPWLSSWWVGGDNGVHAFLKGISPKVDVIAWLECERTCFKATVQHVSHLASGTSRTAIVEKKTLRKIHIIISWRNCNHHLETTWEILIWRHAWCRKWIWRSEFKSWTRLFVFLFTVIHLVKRLKLHYVNFIIVVMYSLYFLRCYSPER